MPEKSSKRTTVTTYLILAGALTIAVLLPAKLKVQHGRAEPATGATIIVPIELVLLVDVSGSVDADEYLLQRNGSAILPILVK